ncbi:uncharacterized protein L3040_002988 [Drepanopeziza brunnea f. sp. 'multigermtubi']|uniref:Uncharacterized protein n=1 Tax=Marssonina brunnea f. sp. multigermtubi (strain MB_m1) TaxID=1072389 RepID=K1WK21_MARBU|nr:uncharacterized protein MBM_08629 [Drepanopeziza brunnea f. sp. 'multigermtubi' MB_m1]EKD13186.1 hypothetical protein MBM_08629 [Drepanopeziza brunnea f. sp. 'multigermtubi' MB_m1]KAJ5047146.1 hypothetical protein L3040_002988 [Drepanopeziza brunnea f. sp. 'multigermtubi']
MSTHDTLLPNYDARYLAWQTDLADTTKLILASVKIYQVDANRSNPGYSTRRVRFPYPGSPLRPPPKPLALVIYLSETDIATQASAFFAPEINADPNFLDDLLRKNRNIISKSNNILYIEDLPQALKLYFWDNKPICGPEDCHVVTPERNGISALDFEIPLKLAPRASIVKKLAIYGPPSNTDRKLYNQCVFLLLEALKDLETLYLIVDNRHEVGETGHGRRFIGGAALLGLENKGQQTTRTERERGKEAWASYFTAMKWKMEINKWDGKHNLDIKIVQWEPDISNVEWEPAVEEPLPGTGMKLFLKYALNSAFEGILWLVSGWNQ